jgi:hypothetical protein
MKYPIEASLHSSVTEISVQAGTDGQGVQEKSVQGRQLCLQDDVYDGTYRKIYTSKVSKTLSSPSQVLAVISNCSNQIDPP